MESIKKKKALLMTLAVFAGIVAVTVAVALILRGRGGARYSSGEDAPYPYSWIEQDNGSISLTLGSGNTENGAWEIGGTDGNVVAFSAAQTKQRKTGVTLTPITEGRETVTFTLLCDGSRLAEVSLTVEVFRNARDVYAATVAAHRERAFQNAVRGGEETGHPFTVRGGDEGLTIFIEESESYTDDGTVWDSQSSDSMVAAVSAIDATVEGVTVRLETRSNGNAEVTVSSAERNISYIFAVEVRGGEMTLTDSRWEPYETEEETTETESEAQPDKISDSE